MSANKDYSIDDILNEYADLDKAPPVEYNKEKSAIAQAKAEKELLSLFEELEEEQREKSYYENKDFEQNISRNIFSESDSDLTQNSEKQINDEPELTGSRFINPDIRGYVPFSGAFEKAGMDISQKSSVPEEPDIPDDILPNVQIINQTSEENVLPFDPDTLIDDAVSSSIRLDSVSRPLPEDDDPIDSLLKELDSKKQDISEKNCSTSAFQDTPEEDTSQETVSVSDSFNYEELTASDNIITDSENKSEESIISDFSDSSENTAAIADNADDVFENTDDISEIQDDISEDRSFDNNFFESEKSDEQTETDPVAESDTNTESDISITEEDTSESADTGNESYISPVIADNITEIDDFYNYDSASEIISEEETSEQTSENSDEHNISETTDNEKSDILSQAIKTESDTGAKDKTSVSNDNDVKRYSRFSFSGNKKTSSDSDISDEAEKDATRRFSVSHLNKEEHTNITEDSDTKEAKPEEHTEDNSEKSVKNSFLSKIRKAVENEAVKNEEENKTSSDFSYRSATRIQDKPTKIIKNPVNNIRYAHNDDDDMLNPKIARKKNEHKKKKLKSEVENLDLEIKKESFTEESETPSLITKLKGIKDSILSDFTGPKTLEQKNQNFNIKSSPEVGFLSIDVPINDGNSEDEISNEDSSSFGRLFTKLGSSFEKSAENKIDDYNSPKDATVILEDLYNLKKGLSVKLIIQIIASLLSFYLCASSLYKLPVPGALNLDSSPHKFAFALFIISAIVFFTSFSVISSGIKNIFLKKADCDSLVAVSMLFCTIAAAVSAESSIMLQRNSIYIFTPVAIAGMMLNTIGKHLIVNRAINNFDAVITTGDKHSLVYIDNEKEAEQLTRGVINDYPILTATRKTGFSSDFLKYTYSTDIADKLCKKLLPVSLILSLLLAFIAALVYSKSINTFSVSFIMSAFTMFLASSSFFGASIVVNVPLADAAAEVEDNESIILGYQSIDDFYDTNAHLISSKDLFPSSSIKLCAMKMFSNTKIDDALVAASSLVINSDSIFSGMFDEIIDHNRSLLKKVENFSFEDSMGICGWISNKRVLFGNRQLMLSHNIEGLPPKSKEKDLTGKGKIPVYLSISGNLATMFIIKLNADSTVRESLEIFKNNDISLIVKSIDSIVTCSRISKIYDFPEEMLSIVPGELHQIVQKASEPAEKYSSSVICKGNILSAAKALSNIRKIHHSSVTALILQSVAVVIAVLVSILFMCTGMLTALSPIMIILYQGIWLLITLLIIKVRS